MDWNMEERLKEKAMIKESSIKLNIRVKKTQKSQKFLSSINPFVTEWILKIS
jgi:hypothetical protein